LEHPRQLVHTCDTLYRDGLIQLHTKTGRYEGGDDSFFLGARFTAILTTRGWIAMVCADPPEGHARWTVRLIAAEAVSASWPRRYPFTGSQSHDSPASSIVDQIRRDRSTWLARVAGTYSQFQREIGVDSQVSCLCVRRDTPNEHHASLSILLNVNSIAPRVKGVYGWNGSVYPDIHRHARKRQ